MSVSTNPNEVPKAGKVLPISGRLKAVLETLKGRNPIGLLMLIRLAMLLSAKAASPPPALR